MSTGTGTGVVTSTESFIPQSAVSICNMALGHLGAKPITQIDEESQEARYCKIFWDNTRDDLLRMYPWNFADASVAGASVTVPTIYDDIWDYAYTYPTEALTIRKVTTDGSDTSMDYKVVLETQTSGDKRLLILTNAETAILYYTSQIEITTLWDPAFITAMAYALAEKLAVPVTKNAKIAEFMGNKAREAVPVARKADFKEGKGAESLTDAWQTARFGG